MLEDVYVRDSIEGAVGEVGTPSERGGLGAGVGAGMGAGARVHEGTGTSADVARPEGELVSVSLGLEGAVRGRQERGPYGEEEPGDAELEGRSTWRSS